mmetsp:Transcript_15013/g.46612  ORF Transcript_15013/g.46612 Transcript_15013/m.46612 type:complete len:117 (+) Transcript_15013:650-1000(+)
MDTHLQTAVDMASSAAAFVTLAAAAGAHNRCERIETAVLRAHAARARAPGGANDLLVAVEAEASALEAEIVMLAHASSQSAVSPYVAARASGYGATHKLRISSAASAMTSSAKPQL